MLEANFLTSHGFASLIPDPCCEATVELFEVDHVQT
jgi:hypothetical protein